LSFFILATIGKNFSNMHIYGMGPNQREYQIILGTILGGSSIIKPNKGKHCYLSMRDKRGNWLEHKSFQLARYASPKPFTIEATNRWHSLCHPVFDEFRIKFYNDGKRHLEIDHLDFWDVGLAVWFVDAGQYSKNRVIINTHVWGEENSEKIVEYFNFCDWPAKLTKDRNHFRVQLESEASVRFMKTVIPEIPFPLTHEGKIAIKEERRIT
jgi:hypothetical protein